MANSKVTLNICGINYVVSSSDDENYVKLIAQEVSETISSAMNANDRLSPPMAATLAALDYCDIAKKATKDADNLRGQIKEYLEEYSKAMRDLEASRAETQKLHADIKVLRAAIAKRESGAAKVFGGHIKENKPINNQPAENTQRHFSSPNVKFEDKSPV